MASTPTTRNRFNKQGAGDNSGTWGTVLNEQDFDLIDEALDGYESIAVAANVTLTSTNYVSDQARKRALRFTGAGGFTVTIPGVQKTYVIHNACTANVTVKTAGGVGAVVTPTTITVVYCDGTDCAQLTNKFPMSDGSAALPGLYFTNDADTGLYRSGANTLDFATGGVNALSLASTGAATFRAGANFPAGSAIDWGGHGQIYAGTNTNVYRAETHTLYNYAATLAYAQFTAAGLDLQSRALSGVTTGTFSGVVTVPVGSAALPSVTFAGDTNTGLSAATADTLVLSTAGTARVTVGATGAVTIAGESRLGTGSAAVTKVLYGTAAITVPAIAAHAEATATITVTGAVVTDMVLLTWNGGVLPVGVVADAVVSGADTVTVRFVNTFAAASSSSARTFYATAIRVVA